MDEQEGATAADWHAGGAVQPWDGTGRTGEIVIAASCPDSTDTIDPPGATDAASAAAGWIDPVEEARAAAAIEMAIVAWLDAKRGRSGSHETYRAYQLAITQFRARLQEQGLDLDAADPRRVRAALLAQPPSPVRSPGAPVATPAAALYTAEAHFAARTEDMTAQRRAAIALLAQAYSTHPGWRGGARARHACQAQRAAATTGRTEAAAQPTAADASTPPDNTGQPHDRLPHQPHQQPPGRPPAPATVNRRLAALSSFYTFALKRDLLRGDNPIAALDRRRADALDAAEPLDAEELQTQLAAIDVSTPTGMRDYTLLQVAVHTGRRVVELANMGREHVTIRRRYVDLVWPRCKGGKRMQARLPLVGLGAATAQALVAWIQLLYGEDGRPDPLLPSTQVLATMRPAGGHSRTDADDAPSNGGQLPRPLGAPRSLRPVRPLWISLARNGTFGHALTPRAIADICEARLGTSKVHALRHTYARLMEDVGAKVSHIQAFLGHADLGTTGRYLARIVPPENPHLAAIDAKILGPLAQQSPTPNTSMDEVTRATEPAARAHVSERGHDPGGRERAKKVDEEDDLHERSEE